MANQLKMALIESILTLHGHGWSRRRIARELGIHRETVGRYVNDSAFPVKPAGNAPTGSPSMASPWRDVITGKLDQGLTQTANQCRYFRVRSAKCISEPHWV
jgi:transposase